MKHIAAVVLTVLVLLAESCRPDNILPASRECSGVRYSMDIKPLVLSNCAITGCHVSGFQPGDFTRYQPLKEQADNGRLRLFVVELKKMPPIGSITDEQRQIIDCWIEQGAPNN